jgi:D-alanyl-D-alanine carboxypeptidase
LTSLPPFRVSVLHLWPDAGLAMVLVSGPAAANSKYAGIVVDAKTGKTLYAHDADELRYPASLTKMMTLYMVFEALEQRKIKLNTRIVLRQCRKGAADQARCRRRQVDFGRTGDLCAGDQVGQ